ncbi:MAG: c-type cytochrome [Acidimicrobiales bacterium]
MTDGSSSTSRPGDTASPPTGARRNAFAVLVVVPLALLIAAFTGGNATASARAESAAMVFQDDVAAGAAVYATHCASCHQPAGRGVAGTFPPLLGNPNAADADYVESVVRNGLTGPTEVLGETYDGRMQAFDVLSDTEISAVVAFVGTLADQDPDAVPDTPVVEIEPGDVDEGRALFIGSDRFGNGGAACSSCHTAGNVGNLGGWSLGPDLTNTFANLGGELGLTGWLANPASETMRPLFADHPMTNDEIADVVAFLGDAPTQTKPSDPGDGLIIAGAIGFLILIGGMALAWRGMRQTYVQRLRSRR